MNKDIKKELYSAKNWILKNQKDNGEILWDDKGKWDFWDHCECLIALSIYEEWEAFRRGLDFCLNMVDQEGLVKSQYINGKISKIILRHIMHLTFICLFYKNTTLITI